MKKITGILLSVLSVCVLGACSGNSDGPASASQAAETEAETSQGERAEETEKNEAQEESRETTGAGAENGQEEGAGEAKVLVAYFSCTNTTRPLAEYAADALGADIYEIVPAIAYTEEDLNYNNSDCRANEEQNNPDSRPEISGSVEGMEEYDIIFLGYPIWLAYHNLIQCTQA